MSNPQDIPDPLAQFRTGLPPTDVTPSPDLVEAFTEQDPPAPDVDPLSDEALPAIHPVTGQRYPDLAAMTEAHPDLAEHAQDRPHGKS